MFIIVQIKNKQIVLFTPSLINYFLFHQGIQVVFIAKFQIALKFP
jgi:hypothetical protein